MRLVVMVECGADLERAATDLYKPLRNSIPNHILKPETDSIEEI